MKDSKLRFSNRAEVYAKYRPSYPREILTFLEHKCGLTKCSVVADVGSGTGLLSEMLLENGNRVFGVEPNKEMREAAERLLGSHTRFESVPGAAEATPLAAESVDLVAVGSAFHWFDAEAARAEFSRILKPGGHVAIAWNASKRTGTPFLEDYARLRSEYRTDDVRGKNLYEGMYERTKAFFGSSPGGHEMACFSSAQLLDFESLKGLLLSYSSIPAEGEPGSEGMLRDLKELFHAHESGGRVIMEYDARVYCGRLG